MLVLAYSSTYIHITRQQGAYEKRWVHITCVCCHMYAVTIPLHTPLQTPWTYPVHTPLHTLGTPPCTPPAQPGAASLHMHK